MSSNTPHTLLIPTQTEVDRIATFLVDQRVEELQAKIGRKMPPDSPILLAMLSSPPDALPKSLVPPKDD